MTHAQAARLHGRVALVTGASRGLGRAIAERLAGEGARVVVNYAHSAGRAEEVVEQIRQEGGEAIALRADVTDQRQVRDLVEQATSHFGAGIDVVWKPFLWLAIIGAVLFALSLARFRKTISRMA